MWSCVEVNEGVRQKETHGNRAGGDSVEKGEQLLYQMIEVNGGIGMEI